MEYDEIFKLTSKNTKGIAKLAALIGCTPDELVNDLLTETLETSANQNSGVLEGFLGAIYPRDRASAQCALERRWLVRLGQSVAC